MQRGQGKSYVPLELDPSSHYLITEADAGEWSDRLSFEKRIPFGQAVTGGMMSSIESSAPISSGGPEITGHDGAGGNTGIRTVA